MTAAREPQVGDLLRSYGLRERRVVRIIELHRSEITGAVRKVRVENVESERRTFLAWPAMRWDLDTRP